MRKIDQLLAIYGESHQNTTNKLIHWICVPTIMFTLVGLIMHIPFPGEFSWLNNWASVLLFLALIYYIRLSIIMFLGFLPLAFLLLYGNFYLIQYCIDSNWNSIYVLIAIFILAWIGQFVGHKIEGKKPSFLQDLQFLLIGPAWLLHFIFRKFGIGF